MPRRKYSEQEIKELISFYKSELKKLQFRIGEIKEILERLQGKVKDDGDEDAEPSSARSSRDSESTKTTAKKGRPKKRGRKKKRAPYKLSDYDNFVMELLEKEDRLLSRNDIEIAMKQYVQNTEEGLSDEQIATKVTRVLHKLGSKRGNIRKYAISGRGYGYGLDKWFFQTTGKLKRKYMP